MVKGGGIGRARVIRGSDSQQQQWERDPFGLGASRHKSSSPVVGGGTTTPHARKLRHMSENIPPDAPPTNVSFSRIVALFLNFSFALPEESRNPKNNGSVESPPDS
jgi:hypothetical protein